MHEGLREMLNHMPDVIKTEQGEYACLASNVPAVVNRAINHGWIILGGDVLNPDQSYTYENWYYNPNPRKSLGENIVIAAQICSNYVADYSSKYGDEYLYVLVFSDSYIGGQGHV